MADTPENKKSELTPDETEKLRKSLHKAIDNVDPKLLSILGGVQGGGMEPGVDVSVCQSKCL